MCLVALAWKTHPRWRLLMAGNRDEFHARPAAALQPWDSNTGRVIAGRDLRSGGTWVGASVDGRAGVVTNFRDPLASASGPSRGQLVADYLAGHSSAGIYTQVLADRAAEYPPFNLVLADADSCQFLGNHPLHRLALAPGLHGMSNGALDAPWPKTRRLMAALAGWLDGAGAAFDPLWDALADETVAADVELPDTGIDLDLERRLSSAFIRGHDYGTRASTLVAIDHSGAGFIHERRFGADGAALGETRVEIPGGGTEAPCR
ncbi:NRDE family protein [Stenotrophomonas sp. YIM B06876]|uniref:NRDE family protein n=1 Tax=Stenotrophomonas sp. YIM B06876 TaxID=3060211 RepID=UPI002739C015|nr:NRDE family protein [Stenotrophomonas sp. YIM B06876]